MAWWHNPTLVLLWKVSPASHSLYSCLGSVSQTPWAALEASIEICLSLLLGEGHPGTGSEGPVRLLLYLSGAQHVPAQGRSCWGRRQRGTILVKWTKSVLCFAFSLLVRVLFEISVRDCCPWLPVSFPEHHLPHWRRRVKRREVPKCYGCSVSWPPQCSAVCVGQLSLSCVVLLSRWCAS